MIKFRLIFLPFLLAFICLIPGYTFIRWLIDIKLHLVAIDEMAWDLALPAGLSVATILLLTRKRLQVFRIKDNVPSSGTKMIMTAALAVPMMIAQSLVSSLSYDLIELQATSDIPAYKHEKFIALEQYRVRPALAVSNTTARVRGKHNENLNIALYVAVPVDQKNNIWYGILYTDTINNRLDEHEKAALYSAFVEASERKLAKHDYYHHDHFELLKKSDRLDGFKAAIDNKYPNKAGQDIYLLYPQEESLKESNNDLLHYFAIFSVLALVVVGVISLLLKIDKTAYQKYLHNDLGEDDCTSIVLHMLTFRSGSPITSLLLNVCILVYIIGIFMGVDPMSASVQELIPFGAVRYDLVFAGEYWRLISAVFVHAGFIHILMNTFMLGFAGASLESSIGSGNYLLLVLTTAVSSSLASIYWDEHALSVGISGVNYGLIGALLVLMLSGYLKNDKKSDVMVLLLLIALSSVVSVFTPNIDHAAHVGGFTAGALLGGLMTFWLNKPTQQQNMPVTDS